TSSCSEAEAARRAARTSGPPTATSSLPMRAGSSPACAWRATFLPGAVAERGVAGPADGDPRRAGEAAEGAAQQALLRRARLGALRADHGAAGILSDAHRAGTPRRMDAALDEPSAATDAGGAGRRQLRQDAHHP